MKITGIDLSLTGTGVAEIHWNGTAAMVETSVLTSKGTLKDTLAQRYGRQHGLLYSILGYARGSDLVVIETLFAAQNAGSLIDRAGLWWRVVGVLIACDVPVVYMTATQGKKFLTGNGGADKGAMVHWAGKLWPEWIPATEKNVNDEADAIALASTGLALMVDDHTPLFPMPEYRRKILDDLTKQQQIKEGVPA